MGAWNIDNVMFYTYAGPKCFGVDSDGSIQQKDTPISWPSHADVNFIVDHEMGDKAKMYAKFYFNNCIIAIIDNDKGLSLEDFCKELYGKYQQVKATAIADVTGRLYWLDEKGVKTSLELIKDITDETKLYMIPVSDNKVEIWANKLIASVEFDDPPPKNLGAATYKRIINAAIRSGLKDNEFLYLGIVEKGKREAFAVSLEDMQLRSLGTVVSSLGKATVHGEEAVMVDKFTEPQRFYIGKGEMAHLGDFNPKDPQQNIASSILDFLAEADAYKMPVAGFNLKDEALYNAVSKYIGKELIIKPNEVLSESTKEP